MEQQRGISISAAALEFELDGYHVTLLDTQPTVTPATLSALRSVGWTVDVVAADALEWLQQSPPDAIVLANLFVHHFEGERLERLLAGIAANAAAFVCCEPRRARLALLGSHMLWALGCNDVTRHDAVVSVHAGFRERELSVEWLRAAGLEARPVMEFDNIEVIKTVVASGLGQSVIPGQALATPAARRGLIVRPLHPPLAYEFALIHRRDRPLDDAAKIVMTELSTLRKGRTSARKP